MSSQYENRIAKEMYRGTSDLIHPIRAGYSGSGAYPLPDIAVFDHGSGMMHMVELKGPLKRDTAVMEIAADLDQLEALRGPNSRAWLILKFQNRCPVVIPVLDHADTDCDGAGERIIETMEKMGLSHLNPRVHTSETGVSRLYIDKPELDNWPSAQASDEDYKEMLTGMGIFDAE